MSHRQNKELFSSDFGLTHSYFHHKKIWLEWTRFMFSDYFGNALNDISWGFFFFSVSGHSTEKCKMKITIVDLLFWTERYNPLVIWKKPKTTLTLLVSFCGTHIRKCGKFKQIKNLLNSAKFCWLEEKAFIGKHIFLIYFPSNSVLRPGLIAAK